jgi:HK97 family phage major capsid protein
LVSITKESSQVAATIWGANIVKMWARMPSRSRPTSVWLINQDCEQQLWGLGLLSYGAAATTDVIPLYFPAGSLMNQGQYGVLMGRPVLPIEYCQTLGTKGDIFLVDPQQYLLVDKAGGLQTASSIHVRFLQDEQTFRVTYRVDGQPLWSSAVTPANGSNTLSPFISLDTRG